MVKSISYFVALTISMMPLLAQSSGGAGGPGHGIKQTVTALPRNANPHQPQVANILTIVGEDTAGLPCVDCVTGVTAASVGLPAPLGTIDPGTSYQFDSYLIDNNYTGTCTFTIALVDHHKQVIVSASQTMSESPNTAILLSAVLPVPANATVGLGNVSTTAVCGTSHTKSQRPVFLACVTRPPHCGS
jgi:hypothetical protein